MQVIKQNLGVFGRLGKGIGKGIGEQLPKEIERGRLASGLQKLEQEKDLDPFQFFTRAASLPGMNPQLLESLGRLSERRMKSQGLAKLGADDGQPTTAPSRFTEEAPVTNKDQTSSITTTEPVQATTKPFIPRTTKEKYRDAKPKYEANPAAYSYDFEKAVNFENQIDADELARNQALQGQRKGEAEVQDVVRKGLAAQQKALGADVVPATVYSDIEDRAIQDVKDGKKTEHQALKDYGKELDKIAQQYTAVDTVGKVGFLVKDKSTIKKNLRNIREQFKERDDLNNLAKRYIAKNDISPSKAYYLAYDVADDKALNNAIAKLPKLEKGTPVLGGRVDKNLMPINPEMMAKKTREIVPQLANIAFNGKDSSPLAIGEHLEARGYDPEIWYDYLTKNKEKLRLSTRQDSELSLPRNQIPPLNDVFLWAASGLDELMEQE